MSQSVRKVVVASPASNASKKISTNAKTFAELKLDPVFSSLYSENLEVVVNPGRQTLTRDEAVLPEGDFQVFLIPKQNKAGQMDVKNVGKEIEEAIRACAGKASQRELESLKENLIEEIESFFDVSLKDEDCPECAEALKEAKKLMR